jgi:hypothetical protein
LSQLFPRDRHLERVGRSMKTRTCDEPTNQGFGYNSAPIFTVATTNINTFLCPSGGNSPSLTETFGESSRQ